MKTAEVLPFPRRKSRAAHYLQFPRSAATLKAYQSDWREWERWCRYFGLPVCPAAPGALVEHLAFLADEGKSMSTIRRRAVGVAYGMRSRGAPAPGRKGEVEALLAAIGRVIAPPLPKRSAPVDVDDMRAIADFLTRIIDKADGSAISALRDRALLLVGWVGAMRRSEIVGLDWRDVNWKPEGLILTLRKTKHRSHSVEHYLVASELPGRCPRASLDAWRQVLARQRYAARSAGGIFRRIEKGGRIQPGRLGAASVGAILRRRAAAAGLPPEGLTAHSLRAGGLTAAAQAGVARAELLRHSRHRRGDTLDGYIRPVRAWDRHPARGLL